MPILDKQVSQMYLPSYTKKPMAMYNLAQKLRTNTTMQRMQHLKQNPFQLSAKVGGLQLFIPIHV